MAAATTTTPTPLDEMSNAELRRVWDYMRGPKTKARAALRVLRERGQVCPDGEPYAFGTVIKQHKIGVFTIVESKRDEAYHGPIPGRPDEYGEVTPRMDRRHSFSTYIGTRDTHHAFGTLDAAIVHAVAYKHMHEQYGINVAANSAPRATTFFLRMIGAESNRGETS